MTSSTEEALPPSCRGRIDDDVREHFPSLDLLIRQTDGRSASEFVETLKDAGHEADRLSPSDTKLDTLGNAQRSIPKSVSLLLNMFRFREQSVGADVIKTDKAWYTYNSAPLSKDFFLRMEPSPNDHNGPCALIWDKGGVHHSLVFCDPASGKHFIERRGYDPPTRVVSRFICGSANHEYTGGTYFIRRELSTTNTPYDVHLQDDSEHEV